MNYYIERHDMEIILDALQALHENMKCAEDNSPTGMTRYHKYGYTIDDVDGLFQSLENSGEEAWDLR